MIRLTGEYSSCQIFEVTYNDGTPVRFIRDRFTGEIRICVDDVARCLGYASLNDMLGEDACLDAISKLKNSNPDRPVFGDYGSGAMFEKVVL